MGSCRVHDRGENFDGDCDLTGNLTVATLLSCVGGTDFFGIYDSESKRGGVNGWVGGPAFLAPALAIWEGYSGRREACAHRRKTGWLIVAARHALQIMSCTGLD